MTCVGFTPCDEADRVVQFVGNDVCKRLGYANPLKQWQIIAGYNGTAPLMTAGGVQLVRTVDRADVLRSSSGARSGRAAV
jgi:hypothetical protein